MEFGEGEEAVEEGVEPGAVACDRFGDGEREEASEGGCAHGGEVAEASGEGAVADGLGGVPVAAEVAAFEGEVGGDEEVVVRGRGKDGAVVADA